MILVMAAIERRKRHTSQLLYVRRTATNIAATEKANRYRQNGQTRGVHNTRRDVVALDVCNSSAFDSWVYLPSKPNLIGESNGGIHYYMIACSAAESLYGMAGSQSNC